MKKKAICLLVSLCFCVALLYVVEFCLTTRGLPFNGYRDSVRYTWGHEVRENALGFRGEEIQINTPGRIRIAVLGDSFTWGAGVAEEDRYPEVAQRLLEEEYYVMNLGISGWSTCAEAKYLEKAYKVLKPDIVVIGFCYNDPQTNSTRWSIERERYDSTHSGKVFKRLNMIGLPEISKRLENINYRRHGVPDWQTALDRAYDFDSVFWEKFVLSLHKIRGLCNHPPIFMVLNNGSGEQITDYKSPNEQLRLQLMWWHQAEAAATAAGFYTVNFENVLRSLTPFDMRVNAKDNHPNRDLHLIYGAILCNTITSHYSQQ